MRRERGYKRKHEESQSDEQKINDKIVMLGEERGSEDEILVVSHYLEMEVKNHKSQIIDLIIKW